MTIGSMLKKCLSCVLAIALLVSVVAPVSAVTATTSDDGVYAGYVALGDAMTYGVGLNDPETEAYYVLVAKALSDAGLIDDPDDYYPHSNKKYRVEEIRYLVDYDYAGDGYTAAIGSSLSALRKTGTVREYIRNADVITVSVGEKNFSTYIVEQMVYYLQNDGAQKYSFDWETISDALGGLTSVDMLGVADSVRDIVMEELTAAASDDGDLALELIDYLVEVGVYAALSYIVNFNGMVDAINELNPDAELYIVGIYNPAEGETLTFDVDDDGVIGDDDVTIPVGDIFGALVELANSYAQVLGNRVGTYTYVDPGTPNKLIDRMADKALALEERIPTALTLSMIQASEETVVSMIQEAFMTYNIPKTYDEALDLAQQIASCTTEQARKELINGHIYEMVVDTALDKFEEKLQEYLGKFSEGNVLSRAQIDQLLKDLDAAESEDVKNTVIENFVDSIVQNEDLQNQAAANVIYSYIDKYGLSDYVSVENVIDLLEKLGECETDEERTDVADAWVFDLAVAKITEYVQGVVGTENYSTTDASTMLEKMNADPDNAAAIARDCLLQDAFHDYMVEKFTETYTENGLVISTYATIDAFVTAVESAATTDAAAKIVRTEVRYAAAGKVAADDTFKTWLGSTMTATDIAELFGGMDAASDKDAYLTEWMYDLFNADPSSNNFIIEYLIDLFASAYVSYDNAATAAVNAVTKYLNGLKTASVAFGEFVTIQKDIVGKILTVYNENCTAGKLDLTGFADFNELRTSAISAVKSAYSSYEDAMASALDACDVLDEKFDKVFSMLAKISEVEDICLNDVVAVAKKIAAKGDDYFGRIAQDLMQGDLEAMEDTTVAYIALCYLFADGMMTMPSAEGHQTIAEQIIKAVNGEPTSSTAGALANAVINKGLDIYHFAKDLAVTGSGQKDVLINPKNYVAFGDDITLGTALDGSGKTYVDLLSQALAMEFNDVANIDQDVVNNLALSGMRAEELLALVDPNYNGDAYTEARYGDKIAEMREQYAEAIASAELITIEVGINNLVTFPVKQAILAYNGEDTYEMDWSYYFGEGWGNRMSSGKTALMDLLNGIVHDDSTCERTLNTVAAAVESMAYGLLGYIYNLDTAVEEIATQNPDATIVLIGFYNPLQDTYINIEEPVAVRGHDVDLSEYTVDVSALANTMINIANRFLTNYVGFAQDDLVAAGKDSRIVTVAINDAEMGIEQSDVSRDLSTAVIVGSTNVLGQDIDLKVPEYFMEAAKTGGEALHPNAAGHEYIYNQILAALDYEIHADVIPNNLGKVYGNKDPDPEEFTYVMDDMSSLYELVVSLKREEGEDAREYDIIATVVENGGYAEVDVVVGTFTITKRPVSVKVVVEDGKITGVTVTGGSIADRDTNEDLTTLLGLVVDGNTVIASEDGNYDTEVTYEFHTSTPEDVDVYIKSYSYDDDGTGFSYYGFVPGFYAYAMFQNGDPVPADFNIVLDEVPVTGSPVGEYTISFTYTDVEGYNVVKTVYCTWEIRARPISVDVTVVDGVITDVQITDGSIAACDEWDGTTAGLVDLLGLEVNVDAAAVTASNSNYDVTINAEFETTGVIQIGYITFEGASLWLVDEVHYNVKYKLYDFDLNQIEELGLLQYSSTEGSTYDPTTDTGALFNDAGIKYDWTLETVQRDGEKYLLQTAGIPAKELGDKVFFRMYVKLSDGTYVYSARIRYSALIYTEEAVKDYPNDEGLHALCAAMLNYGAAAQVYFDYKTDSLMNASAIVDAQGRNIMDLVMPFDDSVIDARLASNTSQYGEFTNKSSLISGGVYSLSLLGAISLNSKNLTYDPTGVTEAGFFVWSHEAYASGETLTKENATMKIVSDVIDGTLEGSVTGIPASAMCDTFVIVPYIVKDGVYHYRGLSRISVDYYGQLLLAGDGYTEIEKNLARCMLVYGEHAENYFR